MGPTTGNIISTLITGTKPVIDIAPYRADRRYI
jgi:glycine/D-amino acid oxidase-like deaminating enzyme